jgi:acylaminoacyl-peptidase
MDAGEAARLTQLEHAPGGLSWGSDGKRLAFTMFVEMPDELRAGLRQRHSPQLPRQ